MDERWMFQRRSSYRNIGHSSMQQPPPPYPIEEFYHRRVPAPAYEAPPPRLFHGPVGNRMEPGPSNERLVIWAGTFDWVDKTNVAEDPRTRTTHTFNCQVSCSITPNGEPEVYADMWPRKLVMQLIPKLLVTEVSGVYLKNARTVVFHFNANPELLGSLNQVMSSGYAGCVHLPQNETNIRIIMLLYSQARRAYVGFVAHDQQGLVNSIRQVIQSHRTRIDKVDRPRPPQHLPVPPWGHNIHQQEPQPIQKVVGWLTHQYPYGGPSTSTAEDTACRHAASATATPAQQDSSRKRKRIEEIPSPTIKSMKVTKHNANIIDETFSCIVCQGPMRHPVVTNCCKSLVACKQCSINWAGESNTCLKCRAVNPVYTEVRGLHEGIGALKDSGFFD